MPLPPDLTKFTTASPAVITYDYVDLSDGTGKVIFYGFGSETDGGIDYHLTRNIIISSVKSTTRTQIGTTTIDFDLSPFNLPQYVKGTALFNATLFMTTGDNGKLLVQLKKWDGSAETNITDEITSQVVNAAPNEQTVAFELPVTTEMNIPTGEQIRLTVKLNTEGTTPFTGRLYHDPNNTTAPSSATSAVLRIDVPFRIPT